MELASLSLAWIAGETAYRVASRQALALSHGLPLGLAAGSWLRV